MGNLDDLIYVVAAFGTAWAVYFLWEHAKRVSKEISDSIHRREGDDD